MINESARIKFVKDFMLPIPITSNEEYFNYFVELYQPSLGSLNLWNLFTKVVNELFNGNSDDFQNYSNKFSKYVVQAVSETSAFPSLSQFNPVNDPQAVSSFLETNQQLHMNVYNKMFHEKFFISIDLKKANFQALKSFNPELVFHCETYEQFMEKMLIQFEATCNKFSKAKERELVLEYFFKSKMLRQIIFGKLLPEKQSKIEKNIMLQMLGELFQNTTLSKKQIMQITSDEIVLQVNEDDMENLLQHIQQTLQEKVPQYQTKVEGFQVKMLFSPKRRMAVGFAKHLWKTSQTELKTVPSLYYAQVYKYLHKLEINEKDLKFVYENMIARFEETLF